MKNVILLLPLIFFYFSVSATIWTVDNNSNSASQFTNIQAAIDSANAGDTIMVEGSSTEYSPIVINKSLTLIGEGYLSAFGPAVTIRSNSLTPPMVINASDVSVKGINIFYAGASTQVQLLHNNDTLQDVSIEHCRLSTITVMGNNSGPTALFSNITLRNTIITGGVEIGRRTGANSYANYRITLDTLTIENSLIEGHLILVGNSPGNVFGLSTFTLRNNVFKKESSTPVFRPNPSNTDPFPDLVVYNNIFYETNPSGCNNCMYFNNSFWDPTFGNDSIISLSGNNNLLKTDPLFVNYVGGDFRLNPTTYDFHLGVGSPCLTAGIGGTQIGIYGGNYPFNIGDGPRIPIVDLLEMLNTAVPPNSPFILKLGARTRK